jgi:hypothetical protein
MTIARTPRTVEMQKAKREEKAPGSPGAFFARTGDFLSSLQPIPQDTFDVAGLAGAALRGGSALGALA